MDDDGNEKKRPRDDDDDDDDDDATTRARLEEARDDDYDRDLARDDDRDVAPVRVGDRLEVQWEIAAGDAEGDGRGDAGDVVTWWPCEVSSVDARSSRCVLTYDARDGFDRESREATFEASGRALTHADEPGATFRWRREGDESEDESEEGANGGAVDDEETTTLREIVDAQRALDAEEGASLEEATTKAFASLPANQQLHVASAVANLRTKLVEKFTALTSDRGSEYVITKEDVDALVRELGRDAAAG